ncbi:right-handed parallel beta-helix repeat-containing protein [Thermococcus sibiricus]|uniref:Right handed beta helix domain-containing protein n=1 Tax=Thermococcus sibiricus TaxID=172049 RepID=A0A101EKR7_9EURY|nr:right-handed parallel beta-helix repeat-containing protein [Thermococcus sibiricus]KUK16997.1 MAG: hypothetical protein XD54_1706 [Thermococcus sibiricus]
MVGKINLSSLSFILAIIAVLISYNVYSQINWNYIQHEMENVQTMSQIPLGHYSTIVYKNGTKIIVEDWRGKRIAEGTAGVDDTIVIQQAINQGGKVFIKSGSYVITKPIIVGDNTIVEGEKETELYTPVFTTTIINLGNNCVLRNIKVNGHGKDAGTDQLGITISGQYSVVENCEVSETPNDPIIIANSNNRVINNYVHDVDEGIEVTTLRGDVTEVNNVIIAYNTVENSNGECSELRAVPGETIGDILYLGNTFRNCVAGILLYSAGTFENINIIGNTFENVKVGLSDTHPGATIRGISMISNVQENGATFIRALNTDYYGCVIQGNRIYNNTDSGINFGPKSAYNCVIKGNIIDTIIGEHGDGIRLYYNSTNNIVEGNVIRNCNRNGIRLYKNVGANIITNNIIKNCKTAIFGVLENTSNIIQNNLGYNK